MSQVIICLSIDFAATGQAQTNLVFVLREVNTSTNPYVDFWGISKVIEKDESPQDGCKTEFVREDTLFSRLEYKTKSFQSLF